jgi:hypothetical protein
VKTIGHGENPKRNEMSCKGEMGRIQGRRLMGWRNWLFELFQGFLEFKSKGLNVFKQFLN